MFSWAEVTPINRSGSWRNVTVYCMSLKIEAQDSFESSAGVQPQTRYHIPHRTVCQHRNWAPPRPPPTDKFWCTYLLTLFLMILHYWLRFPCRPSAPLPSPPPPKSLNSLLFPHPPCLGKEKSMCLYNIALVYNVTPDSCHVMCLGLWMEKFGFDAPSAVCRRVVVSPVPAYLWTTGA